MTTNESRPQCVMPYCKRTVSKSSQVNMCMTDTQFVEKVMFVMMRVQVQTKPKDIVSPPSGLILPK